MEELSEKLREHPEAALQAMIRDYGALVLFVVRGILSGCPAEDVEECVSDTFLYIYENRQRLDFRRGSVKAYLCTVARSKALDRVRRLRRERIEPKEPEQLKNLSAYPSAEEIALSNVERETLIDGILALGEPDSRILLCRYYLNMRTAEIATLLGMRENSVDQRARSALTKLAIQMKGADSNAESLESAF